jgi:hypothetical protein
MRFVTDQVLLHQTHKAHEEEEEEEEEEANRNEPYPRGLQRRALR